MDKALAELMEISPHVEHAVVFTGEGEALASTLPDGTGVAASAAALLAEADELRPAGRPSLTQLQAALSEGSVFVVREGELAIVATTGPDPVIGLVMYDLRTCLTAFVEQPKTRTPRRRKAPA